jgi:hypothetical protein
MAKKKSATGVNKSELIRAYMKEFPEKKPKEVAEFISNQTGEKITPIYVSTIKSNDKKKAGKKPGKRGRKAKMAEHDVGNPFAGGNVVDNGIVAIEAAGALLKACGSVEAARKTLEAIAKVLGQRTGNG